MRKLLLSIFSLVACSSAMAITTDDLAGYYTETCSLKGDGTYVYSLTDKVDTVSITKIDETTIIFTGLFGTSEEIKGIVDVDAKTITISPQTIASWYTLAGESSTTALVATIADDGSISLSGAQYWYYDSSYGSEGTSKLVKYASNDIKKEWSVDDAKIEFIYTNDSTKVDSVLYKGTVTITKYSGGTYPYVVSNFDSYNTLKFYEDADGYIRTNGVVSGDYEYFYYQYWGKNTNDYLGLYAKENEIEVATAEKGKITLSGFYYADYDHYLDEYYWFYCYITWGQDSAIEGVKADSKKSVSYRLDGTRAADNAKGLIIRDGKKLFIK